MAVFIAVQFTSTFSCSPGRKTFQPSLHWASATLFCSPLFSCARYVRAEDAPVQDGLVSAVVVACVLTSSTRCMKE
jgi:hypothetical protein